MRRWVTRGGVALVAVAALPILWYLASRWLALAVDQVYTPRLAIIEAMPIGWDGNGLQLGTGIFDRLVPGGDGLTFIGFPPEYPYVAHFIVDAEDRLVFVKDDARFVLGRHAGTLPPGTMPDGTPLEGHEPVPAYAPEPGDTMSAALDRSLLSWPTPLFQVNWMTGYVPSWQRNLYYRFAWTKASGARLDILWHQRQDYHGVDGWNGARLTELIRIEIRPATGPPVVWVERER